MDKIDTDPLVSQFIDHDLNLAKSVILEGKEFLLQLTFVARENGAPAIFPVMGLGNMMGSPEEKRKMRLAVKNLWKKVSSEKAGLELLAVLLTSDAWVEHPSDEEFEKMMHQGRDKPFTPKPGMAESIVEMVYLDDSEWQYHWPYVRGEGGVVFTPAPKGQRSPRDPRAFLMDLWPLDSK